METLNKYLPLLNLTLSILVIVLFIFYLLRDNNIASTNNSDKPVVVYVLYDTTGNNLNLKDIELLNLNPLTIRVIGNNLYIQKDGEWQKVERGQIIYVFKDDKSIYGQKKSQNQ